MPEMIKRPVSRAAWDRAVALQAFIDDPKHRRAPAALSDAELSALSDAMDEIQGLPNVLYPHYYEIVDDREEVPHA